jgi:hypothetical protein
MFCVFDTNGNEVKLFKDKKDAEEFAAKNHDMLMGRESKKEEVKLDELVPPSRHVGKSEKNPDMFAVYDQKGKEVKLFKDEDDAKEYAAKNHEALMGHDKPKKEEDDLDEAVGKDWQKAVDTLSKKMSASVASGAKGKIITFVSYNGEKTDIGYTDKKGNRHTIYTTKKDLPRAEKDKMIADIRKKFAEVDEEVELDEGQLKDMLAQAGDIEWYAKRHGGIDKKDMMKAASLLKKGNKSGALNFVSKLDTSPREKILDLMGEEVELDEKMKPVDPKTFVGGVYPRQNFNTLYQGLTTIFIVFIGEDWNSVMYDHYRPTKSALTIVYFMFLFIFGNLILLNLFLAILLKNFEEPPGQEEEDNDDEEEVVKKDGVFKRLSVCCLSCSFCCKKSSPSLIQNGNDGEQK